MNLICHFFTLWYFKDGNLWKPLAPLLGEVDTSDHWLSCTRFKAQQLLFEAFLDVTRIFATIEPWSESTFPFLYIIVLLLQHWSQWRHYKTSHRFLWFVYIRVSTPWFLYTLGTYDICGHMYVCICM